MKISRRSFLKSAGGGVALGILRVGSTELRTKATGHRPTEAVKTIHLRRRTLPILRRAEVVVVGGSFAGVSAALGLARANHKVVLVEPRTYLGREITATLRPWVTSSGRLPEALRACIAPPERVNLSQEIPLKLDAVKLVLENLLLEAGVELIYASLPVGLCTEGGNLIGLIIGNKSGRQVLACRMTVDTTETAAVARVAGAEFKPFPDATAVFRRTIEFDHVSGPVELKLEVSEKLGVADNQVVLHRGYRGEEHVLVEFGLNLRVQAFGPADAMQREIEARKRTMELAAYLISHAPAFKKAFLAATSYELHGPATFRMKGPSPEWSGELNPLRIPHIKGAGALPLGAFAGPDRGLWCLNEAARLEPGQSDLFRNPASPCLLGEAFAKSALSQWDLVVSGGNSTRPTPPAGAHTHSVGTDLEVREQDGPQRGRQYEQQPVAPVEAPVFRTVDVLVIGGGTSGATAAATAAKEGMKTLLLEMNPGLGGTGTVAGVDSYWFGRRAGFAARVTELVKEVHESINYQPVSGGKWNIEAKMFALLREAERAGAEVLFNAIVVGAVVEEGNRVRGVVVATRFGLRAVLAEVVIDATGDGDVAAFAGAEYVNCSAMDHIGMWYTLAQFTQPGRNSNSFTSSLDVSNIEECTRAILAGRRRGRNCHDHGVYLAVRESRHILADTVLSLTDQLRQRCWSDVVNVHFSNHDVKGKTTSQWLDSGLIPPNLETEIPYRILLPKGLENILIAGKAISTNHDGLAGIRMQADMENLGGVVALAAAKAVREGKSPRRIDVRKLQARLVKDGVLSERVLTRRLKRLRYTDAELKKLVDALIADKPLVSYQDMKMSEVFRGPIPFVEVCTAGSRIVPMLESALGSAPEDRKVVIAQALAICGSRAGVPILISELERMLAGDKMRPQTKRILYTQLPPDQGAAPDAVYLIYSLGMARDKRSLKVWQRVADILDPREEDFWNTMLGTFCYVDAVCFGAERLGDPATIPILEKLHSYPTLRNLVAREGFQPDYMLERRAMLELAIAKALARCGSSKGFELLIAYLDDNRAQLAEQAHANLVRITRQDCGKDAPAWSAWLAEAKDSLQPRPLMEDLDAVYASEILVE